MTTKFHHPGLLAIAFAAILVGSPGVAAKSGSEATRLLDELEQCGQLAESAQRLACFDEKIASLKLARQKDKTLFEPAPQRAKFATIDATAVSIAELEPGVWLLVLSDHSVWKTTDIVTFAPSQGAKVHVAKGAIGNYLANIGNERAVRVRPMH